MSLAWLGHCRATMQDCCAANACAMVTTNSLADASGVYHVILIAYHCLRHHRQLECSGTWVWELAWNTQQSFPDRLACLLNAGQVWSRIFVGQAWVPCSKWVYSHHCYLWLVAIWKTVTRHSRFDAMMQPVAKLVALNSYGTQLCVSECGTKLWMCDSI